MIKRLLSLVFVVSSLWLTGCASTNTMSFAQDSETVAELKTPVFLLTANVRNDYKPSYTPVLTTINVYRLNADNSKELLRFSLDEKAMVKVSKDQDPTAYLLRLPLQPGKYEVESIYGVAHSFPVVGSFFLPLRSPLQVEKSGVYYLGNVTGVVRERVGAEFRAGPVVPLLDQAFSGASGGTFEVAITDHWSSDEAVFKNAFPALKLAEVKKAILPAFDRKAYQEWWDKQ